MRPSAAILFMTFSVGCASELSPPQDLRALHYEVAIDPTHLDPGSRYESPTGLRTQAHGSNKRRCDRRNEGAQRILVRQVPNTSLNRSAVRVAAGADGPRQFTLRTGRATFLRSRSGRSARAC